MGKTKTVLGGCVNIAVGAKSEGADFVVLGPVYETTSKRKYGLPMAFA